MDHLAYPKNSPVPPLEIPFLCIEVEDDPQRLNVPRADLFQEDRRSRCSRRFRHNNRSTDSITYFTQRLCNTDFCDDSHPQFYTSFDKVFLARCRRQPPEIAASWVQARYFFGLLKVVQGSKFRVCHFVAVSSRTGKQIVSLQRLASFVTFGEPCVSPNAISRCLENVKVLKQFDCTTCDLICLSVEILAWSIMIAAAAPITIKYDPMPYRKDGILQQRMQDAGWCPRLSRQCCEHFSAASLYFITGLARHEMNGNHEGCNERSCMGNNIDMKSYVTSHTSDGCSCKFIGPDPSKMADILRRNRIPIVKLSSSVSGVETLEVYEANGDRPFTAISHVWCGGLGNPSANLLPCCQIKRLFAALESKPRHCSTEDGVHKLYRTLTSLFSNGRFRISDDRYIWIDTLCIPTNPQTKSLRKDAIQNMAHIYAAAKDILVIDPVVASLPLNHLTDAEILMSLATSLWMTRAWTFQEGSLARSIKFLFHDAHVNLGEWLSADLLHTESSIPRNPQQAVLVEALNFLQNVANVVSETQQETNTSQKHDFAFLWSNLAERSTSKREDLQTILAVLFELSPKEILDLPRNQRTRAILRSQDRLPLSMLYFPSPPGQYEKRPGEWVPAFPDGHVTFEYGTMTWEQHKQGLKLSLDRNRNIVVYCDDLHVLKTSSLQIDFHILGSPREERPHRTTPPSPLFHSIIQLCIPDKFMPFPVPDSRLICFDLHHCNFLENGHSGVGACFHVPSKPSNGDSHVDYICPISFELCECSQAPCASHRHEEEHLVICGIGYNDIKCSMNLDQNLWHEPLYRRTEATTIQRSLVLPIAATLSVFWFFFSISMYFDPSIEWGEHWLFRGMEPNPTWPARLSMLYLSRSKQYLPFMRFLSKHQKKLSVIEFAAFRLLVFNFYERPHLTAIARRLQYERFTRSFEFNPTSSDVKQALSDSYLKRDFLYQFQPRWMILFPIVYSTLAYSRIPTGIHFHRTRRLAQGFLIETVLKIGVEIAWRWFRLDLEDSKPRGKSRQSQTQPQTSFQVTKTVKVVQHSQLKEPMISWFWREPVMSWAKIFYDEQRFNCWAFPLYLEFLSHKVASEGRDEHKVIRAIDLSDLM